MLLLFFALLLSVKVKITILILKSAPSTAPHPPRCIILLFQLFLSATPHSGCSPSSDSRALWLFPSVCFTHADVLISDKTTGRIHCMTGKKLHLCVCIATHPSTHFVSLCFPSKCDLSPTPRPPLQALWILNHFLHGFLFSPPALFSMSLPRSLHQTLCVFFTDLTLCSSVAKER